VPMDLEQSRTSRAAAAAGHVLGGISCVA